tara:strand:+ start:300 stop:515 length:216 start_codon:yes stop_codon:yes gene_type:complete
MKKENATWIPQLPDTPDLGWIDLNSEIWTITKLYRYDDLGTSMDTFTIEKDEEAKEIYSYDDGETFTFDAY